jgi:N-acetylmuramoyl-L-alanine amidase
MKIQLTNQHKITPEQLFKDIHVPKNNIKFKSPPDTIIIHYTAGSSAASSAAWLADPEVKASAHVVIGKEGEIYQLVPFDTIAWHAGSCTYAGKSNYNQFSIGIELDNPGFLAPFQDKYVSAFGTHYSGDDVIKAIHRNEKAPRFWHKFPDAQLESCYALCEALLEKYPIGKILGHEEICPCIKVDPGPAFPLDEFRTKLLPQPITV